MKSPLDGTKILDLTIWQNGPWGTVMLSDMGAEVIKIEDPVKGDPGRNSTMGSGGKTPPYFETMNRNKKSLTLNLKSSEGREIFYAMVKTADVVTQNYRVGVVEKLGADYESLRKVNPKIVYVSNSGLGSKGPDAKEGVMDILGQARGGLLYHSSFSQDEISYRLPGGLADQMGAVILAYATLLGIIARDRHGVGQHIEVSQLGSQVILQALAINRFLLSDSLPHPSGSSRIDMPNPLWNTYKCGDGHWIALGCNQADAFWGDFCRALNREDMIEDPKFSNMTVRTQNAREATTILDGIFATRSRNEWVKTLQDYQVRCAPVQDYAELVQDPQVTENEFLAHLDHPVAGTITEVGVPIRMSETPGWARMTAPEFGQHTEDVLLEYGYSWEQIAGMRDRGTI